jgi:multidrug resistance efflux pump
VQLEQGKHSSFGTQAQLRDAQLNYQRFKDLLHESGAMSQQQVDTQKAQADQLEGAVRADQAASTTQNCKLPIHASLPLSMAELDCDWSTWETSCMRRIRMDCL